MEPCQLHTEMKDKMNELTENDRLFVEGMTDIRERLNKVESKSDSAHHRLDEHRESIGALREDMTIIHRLVSSVEQMQKDLSKMVQTLDNHSDRLDAVERKGGEKAERFIYGLMVAGGGVLVGFVLNTMLGV